MLRDAPPVRPVFEAGDAVGSTSGCCTRPSPAPTTRSGATGSSAGSSRRPRTPTPALHPARLLMTAPSDVPATSALADAQALEDAGDPRAAIEALTLANRAGRDPAIERGRSCTCATVRSPTRLPSMPRPGSPTTVRSRRPLTACARSGAASSPPRPSPAGSRRPAASTFPDSSTPTPPPPSSTASTGRWTRSPSTAPVDRDARDGWYEPFPAAPSTSSASSASGSRQRRGVDGRLAADAVRAARVVGEIGLVDTIAAAPGRAARAVGRTSARSSGSALDRRHRLAPGRRVPRQRRSGR